MKLLPAILKVCVDDNSFAESQYIIMEDHELYTVMPDIPQWEAFIFLIPVNRTVS